MSPIHIRSLPYPGHSWYLSQHAVGLRPDTLYGFLQCAAPFDGETRGYGGKITELMIKSGILTKNVRDNRPDAWRDYQQLLAELGLIYSTKISQTLHLTNLAQMFLAGELGFSELLGMQALRYQYPNGQKSTIQARLRHELVIERMPIPQTLTELQAELGILLKPGLLVLRVLIELFERTRSNSLSVSECQAFLIPCRRNSEWEVALGDILSCRTTNSDASSVHRHARRNVQDWFRLLACSDYFIINDDEEIALSPFAIGSITKLKQFCDSQQDPGSYWLPTGFVATVRLKWFDWFGSPPLGAQSLLRTDLRINPEYVASNYIAGLDEDEGILNVGQLDINLRAIELQSLERNSTMRQGRTMDELLKSIKEGMQKRHAKALLHDRIVKELAEKFLAQGARIESDPDSIDLFATWPSGESAIFEVKTVTNRNFQLRLRTAIGQVEEYAYRQRLISGKTPDRIVVVNANLPADAWQRPFLTGYLRMGLISTTPDNYQAAAPRESASSRYWLSRDLQ